MILDLEGETHGQRWYTGTMWNRARIRQILKMNDKAVERAMVALYDRQTRDEKATSDTKHNNNVGFSGAHAKKGSYYARWVLSGRKLDGYHLEKARGIALRYTRQLAEIANANLTREG